MADINKNINITVDTNNSESALNNVEKQLDKISTGHTRVTQSTSSLGKETKKLNSNLLENGGAMGLLGAATGGLAMDFKDAIEAVGGLGLSFKGLRGAIVASGIGLLAIVLLDIISNWSKYIGVIDGSTAALERYNKVYKTFEDNKRTNQLLFDKEIASLNAELLLLEAQGASKTKIETQNKEIRTATLAFYDKQKKDLDDIIDLEQTRFSIGRDTAGNKLSEEELAASLEKRRDAEVTLNKLIIDRNALIADPKVKAAQEATTQRIEAQTKRTEKLKETQAQLNSILQAAGGSIKTLVDINTNLKQISLVPLSSTYTKMKELEDSFYDNLTALRAFAVENDKYIKLGASATAAQTAEIKLLREKSTVYKDNLSEIQKLIQKQKNLTQAEDEHNEKAFDTKVELEGLRYTYDELSKSVTQYERSLNLGDYEKVTEKVKQQNAEYEYQMELIQKNSTLVEQDLMFKITSLKEEEKATEDSINKILESRQNYQTLYKAMLDMGLTEEKAVKEARELTKNDFLDRDLTKMKEIELAEYQRYYELIDRKNDYEKQGIEVSRELTKTAVENNVASKKLELEHTLELELDAMEIKYQAQQEYADKEQILISNVFGFMDALQNEAIIKSKDFRNVLLVAQKGSEIALVVINTLRENSALKMKAADYTKQAGISTALAAANNVINPVAAASYTAAAASYTTAAAKTVAQIPLNFGISGTTIAGILATTATSWNKSSGGAGGGGGGGGAGGGAQAQFNVVGSSGENQLAAQIAKQQNQPVNAFVVGTDVTTQQALDRNKITNASFL